jgi:hypothetical protein
MKQRWTVDELAEQWSLSDEEQRLVGNKTGATRLGFIALLKYFEHEGRFPQGVSGVMAPKRRKTLPPTRVRGRWGWTRVIESPAGLSPGTEGSPGRAPVDPRVTVPPDLMTSDGPPLRVLSGSRRNLNFQ